MLVITVHSLNIKKPCCLDLNCYYFAIVATLISSMINKDLRLIYLYEFKRGTNATETATSTKHSETSQLKFVQYSGGLQGFEMEMKVIWSSNIMGGNVSLTTSD